MGKFDQDYVKKLASDLHFAINKEQVDSFLAEINKIENVMKEIEQLKIDNNVIETNYCPVKRSNFLREDVVQQGRSLFCSETFKYSPLDTDHYVVIKNEK